MRLRCPVLFEATTLICPDKLNFQSKKVSFQAFSPTSCIMLVSSLSHTHTCTCLSYQEKPRKCFFFLTKIQEKPHLFIVWLESGADSLSPCAVGSAAQPNNLRLLGLNVWISSWCCPLLALHPSHESSGCIHSLLPSDLLFHAGNVSFSTMLGT